MRYDLRAPRWLIKRLMGHKMADVTEAYYDRPDGERLAEMVRDLYAERPVLG
jgi:integrase